MVNAGSVDATQFVHFKDKTGVLNIGTLSGFSAVINDFIAGDKIIVQGTSISATSYDETTDVLTLFNASHATIGTLQFGPDVTGADLAADGNGDIGAPAVCFAAGTRIATPGGDVPVERLAAGDPITTLHGEACPVRWLGRRRIDLTAHPRPETVAPVRIQRGAFADNMPHTDLLLSPDHAIFVDGMLICARQLINGTTIRQEKGWTAVEYFHVELDAHAILLAEGLPAESYLDTGNHGFFANSGEPLVLHPDLTDETDYPTREAGSCVPFVWDEASVRPVWQRLAERAEALGQPAPKPETTTDPGLRIVAKGRTMRPLLRRERAAHLRSAEGCDRGAPGLACRLAGGYAPVAGGSPLPRRVRGADPAAWRERNAGGSARPSGPVAGLVGGGAGRHGAAPVDRRRCGAAAATRWMARQCWRSAPATPGWPI